MQEEDLEPEALIHIRRRVEERETEPGCDEQHGQDREGAKAAGDHRQEYGR